MVYYFSDDRFVLRREKFGALVLKSGTAEIYMFNHLGFEILELIKKGKGSPSQIQEELLLRYNVSPGLLKHDIDNFLEELQRCHVITGNHG